jgi:Pyruvate/2-oxoacid:ferredoxin oxidoreductase delta subunit
MGLRKIVEIDRDLCNGCGLCTTACAEGALALDDEGKAVIVREMFCDGMGVCLNVCPTDALTIVERESPEYDAAATREHVLQTRGAEAAAAVHPGPGGESAHPAPSELTQWPIQLHLITPQAPYFKNADLLIAADCTAFALGSFHAELLKGRKMVIACPKLDDTGPYTEKLAALIRENDLKSVTIAIMTVPCCGGLRYMVEQAVALSGVDVPLETVVVGIEGQIVDQPQ